ncbi:MAG TPA: tripartite tricarboxylate transporter substrate-binding protein [Burkholderiaceae bacterium]|nr:tripartite tricarboxylate transporter substrate-binding protein [Burkholderiaceae bacterium]
MKSLPLVLAALGCWLAATAACAQGYPSRSITLIVPFAPGGPTDTVARTVATSMQKRLRQTVIIENVGGAGGTIGAARVASAAPDGYTILLHHVGMATAPALYPNLSFDPQQSFEIIGEVTDVPMTVIARHDFPATNLKAFLQHLKNRKQPVTYAHAGQGSAAHLCGLLFMSAIQAELKTVGYKGTGPAMNDLLDGRVDLMCDQTTNTTPQIRGAKVITFGVTTARRVASLPDVPSLQEQGLKGFEITVWHALYAPRGTPADALEKLNDALRFALVDTAVKARFNDLGTEPVALDKATRAYARAHLQAEIRKWAPVVEKSRKYAD